MSDNSVVLVEVFATPHCKRCQGAKVVVEQVVHEMANNKIQWRIVNVIEEIDYAVQCGIVATPAIAINTKLIFTSVPAKRRLKSAIQQSLHASN